MNSLPAAVLTNATYVQLLRAQLVAEELRLLALDPHRPSHAFQSPGPVARCLIGCGSTTWLWHWLYKRSMCGFRSPAAAKAAQDKVITNLNSELQAAQQEDLKPTGV